MITPETTTVIANPRAAAGRVGREWESLTGAVRSALGDLMIVRTQHPGHAWELAAEAVRSGSTTILSMGGDGTHHEVMNGIMATQEAPGDIAFGVLPAGTGGDFRRLLVGASDVPSCAAALVSAEEALVDVGWMGFVGRDGGQHERHFLNMVSFGVGGLVDEYVERAPKILGGKVTFLAATLAAFATYRHATVRLTLDGKYLGEWMVNNVEVANGRYSGGGMCHAPMARLADGLFDVVVFARSSLLYDAGTLRRIYSGTHMQDRTVHHFQGRHLEAETVTEHPALLDVDGEPLGRIPAEFKVVPSVLRLLNPRPDVL
jgi:YegS/Rv2252/BmrU family lipid kinase